MVYMVKHIDSIKHFVKENKTLSESIKSRIVDARVYLSLLYGLIVEDEQYNDEH